ncbi:MAG: ATP-dependent RNA helicase DbpA [Candidatus Omnitrophota bacterium]|nr:ATP-dependent RNA helicase DbpA [Candidatus Omnitrophota bacterium]
MRTSKEFRNLGFSQDVLANLEALGYSHMMPVQEQSLPFILKGRDLIAQSNSGSGKTAAFGLGILSKIDISDHRPQALVLCPTRELAQQISAEIRRLARSTSNIKIVSLYGGVEEKHKAKFLERGAHIVVGTPGRIKKLLEKKELNLDAVKMLVLDEADRIMEMGFIDDINAIAALTPLSRQTLLFSATFPHGIKKLSAALQSDPAQVTIDSQHEQSTIKQLFFRVQGEAAKPEALRIVLGYYRPESAIVFCKNRAVCIEVADLLRKEKVSSLEIHSDLEQQDRTLVLTKFANKSCGILVATDLASRGLDIKDVGAVINYDLPQDHELYVHRVGRTGRAGKEGLSLSFFTDKEQPLLEILEKYLKTPCARVELGSLKVEKAFTLKSPMVTMYISGGKRDNMRPGDILGALTKDVGLKATDVGQINIFEVNSYVAIASDQAQKAINTLVAGKIKGRKFKVGKA